MADLDCEEVVLPALGNPQSVVWIPRGSEVAEGQADFLLTRGFLSPPFSFSDLCVSEGICRDGKLLFLSKWEEKTPKMGDKQLRDLLPSCSGLRRRLALISLH